MKTEIAKFNKAEEEESFESLKIRRDLKNVIDFAFQEGKLQGKLEASLEGNLEARLEIARATKQAGVPIDIILKATGLTLIEFEKL